MATVEKRQCDVFGTLHDVQMVRVTFEEWNEGTGEFDEVRRDERDMCPRAIARVLKFIKRGTSPPNTKGKR